MPPQPILSPAKIKKNVDNFVLACRKVGLEQVLLLLLLLLFELMFFFCACCWGVVFVFLLLL